MNIIVKQYGSGSCHCRPDTTWERESKDFYSPDCVMQIHWSPVAFARVCKAGKCVGEKFVKRYYDAVGFGMLIYLDTQDESGITCADHTSRLPMPLFNPSVAENEDNVFNILLDGNEVFSMSCGREMVDGLEDALCRSSQLTSLRIGDFVAVELDRTNVLAGENDTLLQADFCESRISGFKIIR